MKVLIINTVCGIRSTGRIVTDIADKYINDGHECVIAFGRESVPEKYKNISYRIGTSVSLSLNVVKSRFFDNEGFNAVSQTRRFIEWANNYNPDVLLLHNLHGYYINIELLFKWIKTRPEMQVKWTLHDCWAFTGHCAHFSFVKCDRWKDGCFKCPQKNIYPASLFFDSSKNNFSRKKACFGGVKNMTIVTPSKWLAKLVKQSFLKEYDVEVSHNSVDTADFRPTESNFRSRHNLENHFIILGVGTTWNERKGLTDFVELAARLDCNYKIVLVGLSKEQIKKMPNNIICIPCTDSKRELAELYTMCDVFLNLSREESFGLTIIEALACGAYPIVYKDTACEEVVNVYGGLAVEQNIDDVIDSIYKVSKHLSN